MERAVRKDVRQEPCLARGKPYAWQNPCRCHESAYQEICDKDNYVTAEKVRNAFLGMGQNHKTLLAVFRQHNEDYAKQVGKMKSQRSYWKYCTVYNHLAEFIKQRYKMSTLR